MKKYFSFLLVSLFFISCARRSPEIKRVVATTSWTAAYALTAGATDVYVLAPYEMVHPSEYELRPGDIGNLSNASLIVFAGYEIAVEQIQSSLQISDDRMLKIETSYNADEIQKSVMLIAKKLGTEQMATKNLLEIRQLLADGRNEVQKRGIDKKTILVHFFQESFAREIGIFPSVIFGPAPPEPKQILEMTKSGANLILDNAHNPVGASVTETLKEADYRLLLNFPGMYQTRTLADVIRYNLKQVLSAC